MNWLQVVLAAAALTPNGALPVRLAPVTCPGFPDRAVRAALQVEIRDRLVPETAPAPGDFALVSVACAGDDAELLVVRQGTGTPVRRLVPLGAVVPDARPRAVAIAIAELLRVDLARNEPPPQLQDEPPAPPPPLPRFMVALSLTPFVFGGYISGLRSFWFDGLQIRMALQSPTQPSPGRAWGWGFALAIDSTGLGSPDHDNLVGSVAALLRHEQSFFTWELGIGAHAGTAWNQTTTASPTSATVHGPLVSLALDAPGIWRHAFSHTAIEAGRDSGPLGGTWVRLILSGGARW